MDDVPSGFTSDSYSDHETVYADLLWPTWKSFTDSLGLVSLKWLGPLGTVAENNFFGTILLKHDTVAVNLNTTSNPISFELSYQDMIDCANPVAIERSLDKISFQGSVKQFRTFRHALDKLLFSMLQPVAARLPQEAQSHKLIRMGFDSNDDSSDSADESKSPPAKAPHI
jgi:hypothetical protein